MVCVAHESWEVRGRKMEIFFPGMHGIVSSE